MSVVAGATAFRAEAEALVEADGGGVAGANFEGEVVGVVDGGPGEEGAEEGGGDASAAGFGENGHGVQLAEVLVAVEKKSGGCESLDLVLIEGHDCGSEEVRVGGVGGQVGGIVGGLPLRDFGAGGGDGEDRVEVGRLGWADGHAGEVGASLGFEKISASERRR
jgi:hypothetical protein